MGAFVGDEVALECGHLCFVEEWGIGPAPKIPHVVYFVGVVLVVVGHAGRLHESIQSVEEGFAAIGVSCNVNCQERAIGF